MIYKSQFQKVDTYDLWHGFVDQGHIIHYMQRYNEIYMSEQPFFWPCTQYSALGFYKSGLQCCQLLYFYSFIKARPVQISIGRHLTSYFLYMKIAHLSRPEIYLSKASIIIIK